MTRDKRRLVSAAYDRIADAYHSKYGVSSVRQKWYNQLLKSLPDHGGCVLDLGCGAGVPVSRDLANKGHCVFGVDSSAEQVSRARTNVPGAQFAIADMMEIDFEENRFDAVCAFYSITHIPANEQGDLFNKISSWLKPGGTVVASLGTGAGGDWNGEWLGYPMFFSHNSDPISLALLSSAGLCVQESIVEQQDSEETRFLWIRAAKPSLR